MIGRQLSFPNLKRRLVSSRICFKIPGTDDRQALGPAQTRAAALGIGAFEAVERECSSEAKIHFGPVIT